MMTPRRRLPTAFGLLPFALVSCEFVSVELASPAASAPMMQELSAAPPPPKVIPVLVFGKNSRRSVEDFAAENKIDPKILRRTYAASGLIECGNLHGAGQLTLTDQVVTTAAHVFFDEKGMPTAKSCIFVVEIDNKQISVPIDLSSIVAGSTNPYAVAEVHDWAVARLAKPVEGVQPYGIAEATTANLPVEFVARGHVDWGEGRRLSMEKCRLHDQLAAGKEGTREFSFDCETGDGASGGAVLAQTDKPEISAVLVGWTSNKPFHAAPFSPTHYNFVVTMEGAFRQAVQSMANKVVVAK
jgi:hypothetical protein